MDLTATLHVAVSQKIQKAVTALQEIVLVSKDFTLHLVSRTSMNVIKLLALVLKT